MVYPEKMSWPPHLTNVVNASSDLTTSSDGNQQVELRTSSADGIQHLRSQHSLLGRHPPPLTSPPPPEVTQKCWCKSEDVVNAVQTNHDGSSIIRQYERAASGFMKTGSIDEDDYRGIPLTLNFEGGSRRRALRIVKWPSKIENAKYIRLELEKGLREIHKGRKTSIGEATDGSISRV